MDSDARIERLTVSAYTIPTDLPEADGTFEWTATTIVVVEAHAAGRTGLGYTYVDRAAATLIAEVLAPVVTGRAVSAVPHASRAMLRAVRNIGRDGLAACAMSAVDCALWDLHSRLLEVPLAALLGSARPEVPAYASGGFTSYPVETLEERLGEWAESGFRLIKLKIGPDAHEAVRRVGLVRQRIGVHPELFVDANGAYERKGALAVAEKLAAYGVTWFEEPVSSDDVEGLRLLRDRAPARMDIAAGEYGYVPFHFRRLLEHGAVDVLQADATRCGGVTGFMRAAALADAFSTPISAHCAPALHVHACCAAPRVRHVEYFHDHVRIETLLFDGAPQAKNGMLAPDMSRPGLGLELKRRDAERHAVH